MTSQQPHRRRLEALVAHFVKVEPHEMTTLLHATASFFFLLSAYFMVIPFRDEAAISLGTDVLPLLFVASLALTLIAAPISSWLLSLPHLSKSKALLIMYRFFAASLAVFYLLYAVEFIGMSTKGGVGTILKNFKAGFKPQAERQTFSSLRVSFYVWIALLNLFTTSALWARLADVMSSEAGSRLFGFIGAGATLGQLTGSILAAVLASSGSFLLLLSAVFMEFAARFALGIGENDHTYSRIIPSETESEPQNKDGTPQDQSMWKRACDKFSNLLEGLRLIIASTYLLHICCFLWFTALISSFFYFERANVVAGFKQDALGRRTLLAEINSFTAVFILLGQLSVTGRLLSHFGVTLAICASPVIASINMAAISISPTPVVIAVSEATRKVTTYVLTKPGREVLFTVISHEEKYKAKVFIDTFVQRLGDAAAAGIYEVIGAWIPMEPSTVAKFALPVCFFWFLAALTLGRRQQEKAKSQGVQ